MFTSILIGNLGADAEVKKSNGREFVTLSIAETRKIKQADGSETSVTNWYDAIISDVNHPVLPYLKQGVKVCVIGDTSLRVFSSKKDRMMKAGATIHVQRIELCGGQAELVPKEVINPETSEVYETKKYYWCNAPVKNMKKDDKKELIDAKGRRYVMDCLGFVTPVEEKQTEQDPAQ